MRKIIYFSIICTLCFLRYSLVADDIIKSLRNKDIKFVEFCFTTPLGFTKSITYPIDMIEDEQLTIFFDGSSIAGCTEIAESDLLLVPDWNSIRLKPPYKLPKSTTALIVCDIYENKNKKFKNDPRAVLKKVLERCEEMGFKFYTGAELEFYITKQENSIMYTIDQDSYFGDSQTFEDDLAKNLLLAQLTQLDIQPEKIHHEVGPGQYEISLKYGDALFTADRIVICKKWIQHYMRHYNLQTTFMPKPFNKLSGNGMHIHFSLWDINKQINAFWNEQNPHRLSDTGRSFIAGILIHARELSLLCNPSINSYKRLIPGYEAPIFICGGHKNRSAMIRIPLFDQPNTARAEIRNPDALSNPYLLFAGILEAGLSGIKNNLSPNMIDKNLYHIPEKELAELTVHTLPRTLSEALMDFKKSNFLKNLLGESLFKEIIASKENELESFNTTITDWEIKNYG